MNSNLSNIILYATTVLIWGFTWLAIKSQCGHLKISIFYRLVLASLLLFGWAKWRKMSLKFSIYHHFKMAQLGVFLFCINFIFIYSASNYLKSGLIAVIFSTVSIMNTINGKLFLGNYLQKRVIAGCILGLVGILTIFSYELMDLQLENKELWGISLAIGGTLSFSLGNIISHKNQSLDLPIIPSTAFSMAYGSLFSLILIVMTGGSITCDYSWSYLFALLYLSLFGSALAFIVYLTLLKRIGVERAAYTMTLCPIVALIISTFAENFRWTIHGCVGVVLTLLGNVIALTKPKADKDPIKN